MPVVRGEVEVARKSPVVQEEVKTLIVAQLQQLSWSCICLFSILFLGKQQWQISKGQLRQSQLAFRTSNFYTIQTISKEQISTCFNYNIKMEKSLIVLLVLITICYQKSPKIKQNKYIFTTDIPSAYSITSQIFTAMKQQQIAKNRPVTGFQPLPQLPNKRKKQPKVQFMGFVNEASAANKPPINLQNQAATIVIEGNNKAIPMKSDSIVFEDKQVSMKQLKNYVLPNIDEKSVFDQKGVLIKSNKSGYTEQAPITPVQKKIEGPKTYNFDVNKKIDQMRQIIKNVMKDPKNSINTGNTQTSYLNPTQDTISSIAGPHKKNIRIDNKKFYPFQTEAEQIRREQEQQIIKILFTSLFFIAILLVVFGYRPQGKKQTERIVSKEEEESTLK